MTIARKKELFMLLIGDIALFAVSLWLALFIRYQEIPNEELFNLHMAPFSILFAFSVAVFYIAGLYGKHTLLFKRNLPSIIFNAQVANAFIALIIFYIIPYFNIAPKRNLLIYLVISSVLVYYWRVAVFPRLGFRKRENAILIGSGDEMRELKEEVNNNPRYNIYFKLAIDLNETKSADFSNEILGAVRRENIRSIIIDLKHEQIEPILPKLYNLIFSHIRFIDKYKVYEDIFDRVPVSLLNYSWFLENASSSSRFGYDVLKRIMDTIISVILGIVSLALYPLVYIIIKLDDGGSIFYVQKRVGMNNKVIKLIKFRTMSSDGKEKVTRVGNFLRRSHIDELPQLWNIFKGDISVVGPRPEIPELVKRYEDEIPYYNVRHLIKPGLSGWAQIHQKTPPKFGIARNKTKVKLSYDLYYIKNRSLLLDIKIAVQTLKALLSGSGV
ncbi:MAG TPA: exopolysaccharide biosynthesis polyprenyl glycosylphosphotransferase [Candidatus Yonathbacteria bacterium]|nr:exopolysaccharide biosynthesis polyprenyl glycosylphosphotransferase [Candidatus Yonathbacteria bacterium]